MTTHLKNNVLHIDCESLDMNEMDKIQLKKGDYFIILGAMVLVAFLLATISRTKTGNQVHISVDGKTMTYSLFDEETIVITNREDNNPTIRDCNVKNKIIIKDGKVYMEYASCPDQVCVRHAPISKNGEMIICLPNEVFVEVENDIDDQIDN